MIDKEKQKSDNVINSQNQKKKRKGKKFFLLILLLIILILLGIVFGSDRFLIGNKLREGFQSLNNSIGGFFSPSQKDVFEVKSSELETQKEEGEEVEEDVVDEEDVVVDEDVAEEDIVDDEDGDEYYFYKEDETGEDEYSGGYNVSQISFGNSVVAWDRDIEGVELKIDSVDVEKLDSMNNESASVLITWVTNKSAISSITYSKKGGGDAKKISEDNYGISHGVFLNDLDFSTEYIFNIEIRDKRKNMVESGYRSFVTGNESSAIINSIKNTIKDFFK